MIQTIEDGLKYNCIFCGRKTNFKDKKKAYCIDCYCKLRGSAHTHDAPNVLPRPLDITSRPFETVPLPYKIPPGTQIIY